jgi:RNA polymerase sigma factor (sigma-70 family)
LHNDQKYIEALRTNDARLLNDIYKQYAPGIKAYLKSRGAADEEAGDIFQEALIDIYKLAADGKFELTCPFEAFLLLVCKRKWLNMIKKNATQRVTKSLDDGYTNVADDADEIAALHTDQLEKESLVMEMLQQISKRCREIIMASYTDKSQEKSAEAFGVSYAYWRKKKSICMAELIKLVKSKKSS